MTARTRRRPDRAPRAVRAVTVGAALLHSAVSGRRRFGMAARAAGLGALTAVRSMAARAVPVAGGRGSVLVAMTALAAFDDAATVRLVAAAARPMALRHLLLHVGVTLRAAREKRGRSVRQPAVTAFAARVPRGPGREPDLVAMTFAAPTPLGQGDDEVVGRVTVAAGRRAVEALIRGGGVMAAAAAPRA